MTGWGKGEKVKGKAKSRSNRARLHFPVGRIYRLLRKGNYVERVGAAVAVYLPALMELLTAEVLELSSNAAQNNKKTHIIPSPSACHQKLRITEKASVWGYHCPRRHFVQHSSSPSTKKDWKVGQGLNESIIGPRPYPKLTNSPFKGYKLIEWDYSVWPLWKDKVIKLSKLNVKRVHIYEPFFKNLLESGEVFSVKTVKF